MRKVTKLHGTLVNWRAVTAAAILSLFALLLLYISEKFEHTNPLLFGKVLPSFAAVVATSGVFSLMYEVFVRREQLGYVLDALELKDSLLKAGLDDISLQYSDFDYAKAITEARQISLFVMHAQSWMHRYAEELRQHLEQDGSLLEVCAPCFDNRFLEPQATHSHYELSEIRKKIAESIALVVVPVLRGSLGSKSRLKVFMHAARPAYSMDRFDDRLLVGTYYAANNQARAPMFEFINVPGSMYNDFMTDFGVVTRDEAHLIFDSDKKTDSLGKFLGAYMPASLARMLEEKSRRTTDVLPDGGVA